MNTTAVRAAAAYFGIVFGAGFVFGTLRTLVLVPAIGPRAAEFMASPLMLVVITLLLVLIADTAVGVFLRGSSVRDVFLERDPLTGTLYYAMLLVFAAMPAFMFTRRRGRAQS